MLIDFGLSLSYNRPKLCPNAIWNTNATTFTNTPTINGQLIGIFVDSNNTVYFADTSNDRVLVWSGSNGTLIRTITSPLKKPMSVFVTMNGDIYVDTEKNSEIDIYKFNATIGIKKMSVSDSCYGLFIDLNNTLYCSIQNLNTVISQLLDNNGTSASFTYGTGWGGSANELNKPQDSTFLSTVLTTDQTGIDSTISSVITTISSSQIYATTPIHTTQIITNSPLTISATSTSSLSNFIVPTCNSSSYIGSACNISSAPCVMLDPCQNAGTCINNNTVLSGYICQCSFGFNGTYCEVDTRPCKANTCWYNGSCSNRSNSNFTCECQEGWEGNQCETMVNYCENITCENGGICQGLFGDYNCECLSASYSGRHCEITANILVARKAISKSVGYIGLLCITGLVSFIIILDILKYGFHIDPIRAERKRMRQKKDQKRRRKPTVVVRFQYIDEATSSHSNVTETIV
ncbi:unnamed protein product [Adineta steineri]|uniref:EGF-like domain-containing protein n=1 Tax=Adineta steineri TaxID=433720 RepID=A0A815I4I0_9BILA|nr:unnamed protein product [Adineta steineri]